MNFLREAQRLELDFRYGDLFPQEKGTIAELIRTQQTLDLYGSEDALSAAQEVGSALLQGAGKEDKEVWRPFDEAMADLRTAMRDDLGIK